MADNTVKRYVDVGASDSFRADVAEDDDGTEAKAEVYKIDCGPAHEESLKGKLRALAFESVPARRIVTECLETFREIQYEWRGYGPRRAMAGPARNPPAAQTSVGSWTPIDAVTAQLRGWYLGDVGIVSGKWIDSSGFHNDATVTGTPTAGAVYGGHASVHVSNGNYCAASSFSYGTTNGAITLGAVAKITSAHAGHIAMYSDGAFNGESVDATGTNIASANNDISTPVTGTTDMSADVRLIVTTKVNGGQQILYVNGVSEGTPITAIANNPGDLENLTIGTEVTNPGAYVIADIYEVFVWNGLLDAGELAKLASYSKAKYGYVGSGD